MGINRNLNLILLLILFFLCSNVTNLSRKKFWEILLDILNIELYSWITTKCYVKRLTKSVSDILLNLFFNFILCVNKHEISSFTTCTGYLVHDSCIMIPWEADGHVPRFELGIVLDSHLKWICFWIFVSLAICHPYNFNFLGIFVFCKDLTDLFKHNKEVCCTISVYLVNLLFIELLSCSKEPWDNNMAESYRVKFLKGSLLSFKESSTDLLTSFFQRLDTFLHWIWHIETLDKNLIFSRFFWNLFQFSFARCRYLIILQLTHLRRKFNIGLVLCDWEMFTCDKIFVIVCSSVCACASDCIHLFVFDTIYSLFIICFLLCFLLLLWWSKLRFFV